MAQKPNKFVELIKGYLTGLLIVVVVLAAITFLKHHH